MLENERVDAIVLGCNYANALGMVKSVGEAGYRCGLVHHTSILKKSRITPDMASRYVYHKKYIDRKNDEAMLDTLLNEYYDEENKVVLLPADDYSASFVDRYYDELAPYFLVSKWESGQGRLTYFMEKEHQKVAAKNSGFPVAESWTVPVPVAEDFTIPEGVIFPCITKPEVSAGHGMSKELISVCHSEEELTAYFKNMPEDAEGVILIEEFLTIEEEYTIPGIRLDDEVIIPSFVRKVETGKGKVRGLTVTGEVQSTDICPQLKADIEKFVRDIGLVGIFDVEIIRCNGKYYFNEINLRSSAATYAITGSGVNIPGIFIDYMLGKDWRSDNREVKVGNVYINEKPALQCYAQKDYTLKQYNELIEKADVHLLTGEGDDPSKEAFKVIEKRTILKTTYPLLWLIYRFFRRCNKKAKKFLVRVKKSVGRRYRKAKHFVGSIVRRAKRMFERKFLIDVQEITDDKDLTNASNLLEETFQTAMQRDDFDFTNSTDFIDSLKEIIADGGKVYAVNYGKKFAGTISYKIVNIDEWYYQGEAVSLKHLAVAEKYQQVGIGRILIGTIKEIATDKNLPMVLSTPEANKRAVRFYIRNGFKKVKMFRSSDHFTIRFINWNGLEAIDSAVCKENYENTAFYCMLKNQDLDITFSSKKLQRKWETNFGKYIQDADEEQIADIRKCFRRYGATAKEYFVFDLQNKSAQQRSRYITSNTLHSLAHQYDEAHEEGYSANRISDYQKFPEQYGRATIKIDNRIDLLEFIETHPNCVLKPNSRSSKKNSYTINEEKGADYATSIYRRKRLRYKYIAEEIPAIDEVMSKFIDNYIGAVRVTTFKTKDGVSPIYALMNYYRSTSAIIKDTQPRAFSDINVLTGRTALTAYRAGSSAEKIENRETELEINKRKLPDWDKLIDNVTAMAKELPEALVAWDMIYVDGEWKILDINRTPSFKNAQLAKGKGLKPTLDEILDDTINTRIVHK